MTGRLRGRVSIVTGGGQGIGRSIALRLASEGSDVVVADINIESAEKVSAELRDVGVRSISIRTDISNIDEIKSMVEKTMENFSKIDVLVNNAGVVQYKSMLDITEEDWDATFRVNMKGTFFCIQEVAHEMAKRGGGSIVNLASIAAKHGSAGLVHYSASKAGVIGLTRAAARELAPLKIRVNGVCPGTIITPMHFRLMKEKAAELARHGVKQEYVKSEFGFVPLGRDGTPEDVAGAVAFLVSDDSGYMTGQSLNIDGGELMD